MTLHAGTAAAQLTLDLEPGLVDRHPTLLDCLRAQIFGGRRQLKVLAADMDMSASDLGRKISGNPDDVRRFSVCDLEAYVRASGDTTPIEYLAAKYLQTDEVRRAQTVAQAARLLGELAPLLAAMKGGA